jgi:predicted adenylyl cyclase CyaB
MARNVEIKARVASVEALLSRAAALADRGPELLQQDDTFFSCASGRLKLRVFADGQAELIAYTRPDAAGPKLSDYSIARVTDPDTLRQTLERALGQAGRVRKQRTLFLVGRTRVHLDRIEGLGDFLELEVVLADDESAADGDAVARDLLARLGVGQEQLIRGAYVDLINAKETP